MSLLDRTLADYKASGITVGPHIMKHLRDALSRDGVLRACDLKQARNGSWARIAGLVIVRQRPGTAKGFCFITLEDETGTANAVVVPDVFQRYRSVIHTAALLCIEGPLQKVGVGDRVSGVGKKDSDSYTPHPTPHTLPLDTLHPTPDTHHPVIHVRARRMHALALPQQPIGLTGSGYRMRVTPQDTQPDNQRPAALPKSHDFR